VTCRAFTPKRPRHYGTLEIRLVRSRDRGSFSAVISGGVFGTDLNGRQ
jgi:hypothetical protein